MFATCNLVIFNKIRVSTLLFVNLISSARGETTFNDKHHIQ